MFLFPRDEIGTKSDYRIELCIMELSIPFFKSMIFIIFGFIYGNNILSNLSRVVIVSFVNIKRIEEFFVDES